MEPRPKAHPETVGSWLFTGNSLKTYVFAILAAVSTYYIQQGRQNDRIAVNETNSLAVNHRIDEFQHAVETRFANQLAALQALRDSTVRRDTYTLDIDDLRKRQLNTDQVLMDQGFSHPKHP